MFLVFGSGWDDLGLMLEVWDLAMARWGHFGTHGSIRDNGDIVSITYDT